ncbi:class I SAM-dependent methyltransferase [Chloroflexota bacterium]
MLKAVCRHIVSLLGELIGKEKRRHYIWMWEGSLEALRDLKLEQPLVIDIGCGDGRRIMTYRDCIGKLIGLDIDAKVLTEAKARGIPVIRGDALKLPFKDRTFDAVTSFHSIEHVTDDLGYLNEIHRVLKKDGDAVIELPNRNRLESKIRECVFKKRGYANHFHYLEYDRPELEALCRKSNFKQFRIEPIGFISLPGLEMPWFPRFFSKYCYSYVVTLKAVN